MLLDAAIEGHLISIPFVTAENIFCFYLETMDTTRRHMDQHLQGVYSIENKVKA